MSKGGEKRQEEYYKNKMSANQIKDQSINTNKKEIKTILQWCGDYLQADNIRGEEENHFQMLALCCEAKFPFVSCTVNKLKRKGESREMGGR